MVFCYNELMRIAIISDIHDNLANLEKFLIQAKTEKIEGIICCGDVTTPETLSFLVENFKGEIKLVCGNAEIRREEFFDLAKQSDNLEVFADVGRWDLDKVQISFAHKPEQAEGLVSKTDSVVLSGELHHFVFYGHTHKPWIKQIGETLMANPGTLGGVFTSPSYASLDTVAGQLALHRL